MTITLDPSGCMVNAAGPIEISSVPAHRLLAHLVLCPQYSRREVIADRIWGEGKNPSGSLRQALVKLKEAFGDAADAIVKVSRSDIALVDRDAFAADVLRSVSLEGVADDRRPVNELILLNPNQLFPGLYDPWVVEARDLYRERIVVLLRGAAVRLEAEGDLVGANRALRRRAQLEGTSGDAHLAIMSNLRAQGDIAGALRIYNAFRMRLMREDGLVPSPALRSLYEELLGDEELGEGRFNVATPQWARARTGWVLVTPGVAPTASPVEERYQSYAARFLALSFTELVSQLPAIERTIRDDALSAFTEALTASAEDVRGDVVWIHGLMMRVGVSLTVHASELVVLLEPLGRSTDRVTIVRDVGHFGATRAVRFEVPRALEACGETFADDLARRFREAYMALEAGYLAAYKRWVASAYDLLYEVVNVQLQIKSAHEAVGRYWFSITDLAATTFRYHIDAGAVKQAIDHLKAGRPSGLPIWLAVSSLILDEVPDGVFGAENSCRIVHVEADTTIMRFDSPVTRLRFDDLPTLGHNTQFWMSERLLYGSDEIAAVDVGTAGSLTLQANCPIEHVEAVAGAVDGVRDDLELTFAQSLETLVTQRAALAAVVSSHHLSFATPTGRVASS